MLNIGCHLSSSKGYAHMGKTALSIGANTFQFFSRNPRGSKAKAVDAADAQKLMALAGEHGFAPLLAHAPYTLNACAADPRIIEFAPMVLAEDIAVMDAHLPGNFYNFHPGSHVGQGTDAGIGLIAGLLDGILHEKQTTMVLLETMSGKGSEVGSAFEEIRDIIQKVRLPEKLGVCLDTCHVYSAGYDIVNDLEGVLDDFDRTIGLEKLRAIHLNDSLTPFASHKDRHAGIGKGSIGLEATVALVNHPKLRHLPFYLETPNELPGYAEEIALLRGANKD